MVKNKVGWFCQKVYSYLKQQTNEQEFSYPQVYPLERVVDGNWTNDKEA